MGEGKETTRARISRSDFVMYIQFQMRNSMSQVNEDTHIRFFSGPPPPLCLFQDPFFVLVLFLLLHLPHQQKFLIVYSLRITSCPLSSSVYINVLFSAHLFIIIRRCQWKWKRTRKKKSQSRPSLRWPFFLSTTPSQGQWRVARALSRGPRFPSRRWRCSVVRTPRRRPFPCQLIPGSLLNLIKLPCSIFPFTQRALYVAT